MSDLDRIITYTFRMQDNVSQATASMKAGADSADRSLKELTASSETARTDIKATNETLMANQVTVMTQLTALMGLRSSVSAVTSGLRGLGLVSDETAEQLQKINAAFALFSGGVTAIKSVQAVMTTLNASTALYSTMMTYLSVLKNPIYAGIAGAGIGVAAGVGAHFLTQNNETVNQETVFNITGNEARQTADEIHYIQGALR